MDGSSVYLISQAVHCRAVLSSSLNTYPGLNISAAITVKKYKELSYMKETTVTAYKAHLIDK